MDTTDHGPPATATDQLLLTHLNKRATSGIDWNVAGNNFLLNWWL